MADPNSGHVAATTAFVAVRSTVELDGENEDGVHHINLVFIALIVGSLACVFFMCIYMIIRKRKCPCCQKKNVIDRGDSVVVEEINVQPWKIKIGPPATPVSSPSYQPNNSQHHEKIQQPNIRHIADSSGDSMMQLWDNTNIAMEAMEAMCQDNENETDDDDMYLQPKLSVASQTVPNGSHHSRDSHLSVHSIGSDLNNIHYGHQKKISISANNNFAIETNEISANDELIEGSEYETSQNRHNANWPIRNPSIDNNRDDEKRGSIDDMDRDKRDGRHERNLTGGDLNIEDDYQWIEMALRQIDEKEWIMYLKRFKKNKVTTYRLNNLVDEDWRELLPEIGIRRDFRNLLKIKHNL